MKIKIISVYIGTFPYYFDLVKKSMKTNKKYGFEFDIHTDNVSEITCEENIRFIPHSLEKHDEILTKIFNSEIKTLNPYKICDSKPLFGLMFKDTLESFDWWGFADLDVVYGDLGKFLTKELLDKHEVFTHFLKADNSLHGPFSLFKNNEKLLKLALKINNYVEILNKDFVNVDEIDFADVIRSEKLKTFQGVLIGKNNAHLPFIRYGKRPTPAEWKDGTLTCDTFTEDYFHKFDFYGAETMLMHVRKDFNVSNGKIIRPLIDGEIKKNTEKIILNSKNNITNKNIIFDDVLIIDNHSNLFNYYHFLIEYFPLLCEYRDKNNLKNIKLFFQKDEFKKHPFIRKIKELYTLFYKEDLIIINDIIDEYTNFEFNNSYSLINHKRLPGISGIYIKRLREIITNSKNQSNSIKRILIKRKDRKIPSEIIQFLIQKHNFVEMELENFSISEQASLFYNAEIILGSHGAGLTNMIFCKTNTKIIELDSGYNYSCFVNLRDELLNKTENLDNNLFNIFDNNNNKNLEIIEIPNIKLYSECKKTYKDKIQFNVFCKVGKNKFGFIKRENYNNVKINIDFDMSLSEFKEIFEEILNA